MPHRIKNTFTHVCTVFVRIVCLHYIYTSLYIYLYRSMTSFRRLHSEVRGADPLASSLDGRTPLAVVGFLPTETSLEEIWKSGNLWNIDGKSMEKSSLFY